MVRGEEMDNLSFPLGFELLISGNPVCQSPYEHHGQQGNDPLAGAGSKLLES